MRTVSSAPFRLHAPPIETHRTKSIQRCSSQEQDTPRLLLKLFCITVDFLRLGFLRQSSQIQTALSGIWGSVLVGGTLLSLGNSRKLTTVNIVHVRRKISQGCSALLGVPRGPRPLDLWVLTPLTSCAVDGAAKLLLNAVQFQPNDQGDGLIRHRFAFLADLGGRLLTNLPREYCTRRVMGLGCAPTGGRGSFPGRVASARRGPHASARGAHRGSDGFKREAPLVMQAASSLLLCTAVCFTLHVPRVTSMAVRVNCVAASHTQ